MKTYIQYESTTSQLPCKDMLTNPMFLLETLMKVVIQKTNKAISTKTIILF